MVAWRYDGPFHPGPVRVPPETGERARPAPITEGKLADIKITDPDAQGTDYDYPPESNGQPPQDDLSYLFAAPDLSQFVRVPTTGTAREYEKKTAAFLKAAMIGAINSSNFPDAAALIKHGPGFSAATGALAAADDRAKGVIDFLTTPANPYALFLITTLPLVSQLWRNHESEFAAGREAFATRKQRKAQRQAEKEAQPKVTMHLPFGKTITLGIRARFPVKRIFASLRTQTTDPRDLTVTVFSDPKIINYLRKQGINIPSGDG